MCVCSAALRQPLFATFGPRTVNATALTFSVTTWMRHALVRAAGTARHRMRLDRGGTWTYRSATAVMMQDDWAIKRSSWTHYVPPAGWIIIVNRRRIRQWIWRTTTSTLSVLFSTRWFVAVQLICGVPQAKRINRRTLALQRSFH